MKKIPETFNFFNEIKDKTHHLKLLKKELKDFAEKQPN